MATYTGSDKRLKYLFQNGGGGGGSCKVISGYYYNGVFYEDSSHTTPITGSIDSLYIDISTTKLYLYDGSAYEEVGEPGASALNDLSDVHTPSPTNGHVLTYNEMIRRWTNAEIPLKVVHGKYRNGGFYDYYGNRIYGELDVIYVGEDLSRHDYSAYVFDSAEFHRVDKDSLAIATETAAKVPFPFGVWNNQYGYYTGFHYDEFHPFNENIYACDLLLDNTDFSITSGTGNVNRDYTLSASANDYDAVVVMGYIHVTASTKDQLVSVFVPKGAYLSGRWQYLMGFDTRRLMFGFTSDGRTIQSICVRNANEEPRIYRVYGLKFGSSGTGSNKHTYSTTEQVVGTWIDGKPIYEKTISGTTIIGGRNDYANHGISALETVVDSCIMAHFSDIDSWRRLNFSYNNGNTNNAWLGGYAIMPTQIMFQIGTSLANTLDKWNATIRYTKSTD